MAIFSKFHGDFQISMQLSQCVIRVYLTAWSKNFFLTYFLKQQFYFSSSYFRCRCLTSLR